MMLRSGAPEFRSLHRCGTTGSIPESISFSTEIKASWNTIFRLLPALIRRRPNWSSTARSSFEVVDGALVIKAGADSVRLDAPRVYQEIAGQKQAVEGSFVLRGPNRAGFAVGAYDRSRELVIDPILNFSTYFGGSGDEHATSVAVDGSLNVYITGNTTSPNLPFTAGVFQTTLTGTQNVYVAKIQPPLGAIPASLEYMTYLGGNGTDSPNRNQGGRRRKCIYRGHDVLYEFSDDRDDRVSNSCGDRQHRNLARICHGTEQRTDSTFGVRAHVFDLPLGQWNRRRERHDDRCPGKRIRNRHDNVARRGEYHRSISGQHAAARDRFPNESAFFDPVFCDEGQYDGFADGQHLLFNVFWRR